MNTTLPISSDGLPLVRVEGDPNHPFMMALRDLCYTNKEALHGLIEVAPCDRCELSITEIKRLRPPYLRALNDISQLLQNHGYEDASKFLDCTFEL